MLFDDVCDNHTDTHTYTYTHTHTHTGHDTVRDQGRRRVCGHRLSGNRPGPSHEGVYVWCVGEGLLGKGG